MSAWSTLEGEIRFYHKNHKCSIEKLIKSLYSENILSVEYISALNVKITWTFSLENSSGWELVNKFIQELKKYDNKVQVDCVLSLRVLV